MKRKLFWCMTALTALVVTSCSSELALEGVPNNGVDGEEVEVTFSVSAMNSHAVMRADNDQSNNEIKGPGAWQKSVGRGHNIDMLIYAVYEKEGDKYTLLTQYGKGLEDFDETINDFDKEYPAIAAKKSGGYEGQTVRNVGEKFKDGESVEITLRLMRNKEYHIAFWAQSSQTIAFNTDNLEKVQVIYENAKNNDELRDAFCKVESFTVSAIASKRNVILTRPMAQINVGTTGADYKTVINAKKRVFTQSRVKLGGVAQYLNVVTDEVDGTTDNLTEVEFNYGIIPAFMNTGRLPNVTSKEDENGATITTYNNFYDYNENEEYLVVDLNNDGNIIGYKMSYPTLGEDGSFLTETFKYLSMCYALVPASKTIKPNYDESTTESSTEDYEDYNSALVTSVDVWFAQTKDNKDGGEAIDEYHSISLQNVPVHRNWRTNILCGLNQDDINVPDEPGPTPPEDEEDEDSTSIYRRPYCYVVLDTDYTGEWNKPGEEGWMQNSFGSTGN